MADRQRALEEALMLIRSVIHKQDVDALAEAFDVIDVDDGDFDSTIAMLLAEMHQHELDHRDDGWWVCWCDQYVRRVEYDDLFDPDEHR